MKRSLNSLAGSVNYHVECRAHAPGLVGCSDGKLLINLDKIPDHVHTVKVVITVTGSRNRLRKLCALKGKTPVIRAGGLECSFAVHQEWLDQYGPGCRAAVVFGLVVRDRTVPSGWVFKTRMVPYRGSRKTLARTAVTPIFDLDAHVFKIGDTRSGRRSVLNLSGQGGLQFFRRQSA